MYSPLSTEWYCYTVERRKFYRFQIYFIYITQTHPLVDALETNYTNDTWNQLRNRFKSKSKKRYLTTKPKPCNKTPSQSPQISPTKTPSYFRFDRLAKTENPILLKDSFLVRLDQPYQTPLDSLDLQNSFPILIGNLP